MQFTTWEPDFLERAWSKKAKGWSSNPGSLGAKLCKLRQANPSISLSLGVLSCELGGLNKNVYMKMLS